MRLHLSILLSAGLVLLAAVTSCGTVVETVVTRGQQYPKLYAEAPGSIVIMPPVNRTNAVEAKEYFYTTLYRPLCEKGYYVFSPYLTMELFRSESAYDSELFLEGSLKRFREIIGADAAMFTVIKAWERDNLGGKLTARVEFILRSTTSGEVLYRREGNLTVDTDLSADEDDRPLEVLLGMAATMLTTSLTDQVVAGRRCTDAVLSDMPLGKYSPAYGTDREVKAGKSYFEATVK